MESPLQRRRSALAPARDASEIVAAERLRSAQGRGIEDVGGGGDLGLPVDDLADDGGVAQRLDHALRAGVGAERHVDPARQVAGEALHGDAAAGEDPDAVGDVGAGLGQDADIVAGPVRPRCRAPR